MSARKPKGFIQPLVAFTIQVHINHHCLMNAILLLSFFGPEMIIVLVAILLLFGGKKIPELMRGLGSGIREFNDAKNKVSKELEAGINEEPKENKKEYEKS